LGVREVPFLCQLRHGPRIIQLLFRDIHHYVRCIKP
jgi:hypothetical protein